MLSALNLFVCVLIIAISRVNPFLCLTTDQRWSVYTATPAPGVFEGDPTEGPGCVNGTCLGPGVSAPPITARLADGNLGTQDLNGAFVGHAWNQTVTIEFDFNDHTTIICGINLYFYNIPSKGIGLPYNIRIISQQAGEHQYLLQGNNNLTLEDTGLQTVTLTPQSLSLMNRPNDRFTIEFDINNKVDHITWLLLTEVEFCTSQLVVLLPDPLPPIISSDTLSTVSPTNITSSITLTCSVTEGRFDWAWTQPPNPTPTLTTQQLVLNAGRTSVLELSGLSSEDEGTYQCQATPSDTFGTQPLSPTFNVQLSLQGALQAENTAVEVRASDETAVLRCFLYGYLPSGAEPTIIWQGVSTTQISNDSFAEMITFEPGDKLIQNGGAQSVPSLTSSLTVNLTSSPLATSQQYGCSSDQLRSRQVITLTVVPDTAVTSTMDSVGTTTSTSKLNIFVPIGAAIGATIILLTTILTILIVTALIVRHIRKTKTMERRGDPTPVQENEAYGIAQTMLTTVRNDPLPSIPINENKAYRIPSNTFNMTQNTMYSARAECGPGELTKEDMEPEYEELESITVTL